MLSQRPAQHGRPKLDDGHDIKQQHERAERKRDSDRARVPAPLLLRREHDAFFGFIHDRIKSTSTVDRSTAWRKSKTDRAPNSRTAFSPQPRSRMLSAAAQARE